MKGQIMANFLSRFFKSKKDVPESVDKFLEMAKKRLKLLNFSTRRDLLIDPRDVLSRPDFALSILVGAAFEMRKDPFDYVVNILKVLDIVFTPKWRLMVKVAIVQYRMGLFINVLKDMQDADLEMPVRNTGVTYATCIERTTEELEDELKQINGLLEEAKVMVVKGEIDSSGKKWWLN
jgi:hypothetical protein